MMRRVLLIVALIVATGILASGCYEAKRHVLETSEYVRVIVLDDDGLGTIGNIK